MRYVKLSLCFVFVLILSLGVAFGQNGEGLDLQACIDIALQNNSDFKTAQHRVNLAGANVTAAKAAWLPSIDATFNSGRNVIGETENFISIQRNTIVEVEAIGGDTLRIPFPEVDATGRPIVDRVNTVQPSRRFWGHSMTVRYNHTLFDFGRTVNSIKQANRSFSSSTEDLTSARYDVHALVSQRYFELLKAIKLEQEFEEAVERSNEQLERTQSMYEIGSVAQIDVYRQEEVLGQDEINLITQANVVELARANLNVAMGRDPETDLTIIDGEYNSDMVDFSLTEAFAIAQEKSPELRGFEYDMKAAEYGRKSAKSNYLPSLGIGATYSRDNQEFNKVYSDLSKNYFLSFGASLSWNIFNGFADKAQIERETANYNIAEENWRQQQRILYVTVKQHYLSLKAYNDIAEINQRNLRAAEEGFRLAQERYRVGAGTQLEVTDAQVALTRARVQLVRANYDAIIAKAQLEATMGTIEGQQQN